MLLKRHYHPGTLQVSGVEIKHTGVSPEQNFSRRVVTAGLTEGWLRIEGDKLTLDGANGKLEYVIRRSPGYYCKSTGERIPVSDVAWTDFLASGQGKLSQVEARAWLLGRGKDSSDYEITLAWECVLAPEDHEKWHCTRDVAGNVVSQWVKQQREAARG